MTRKGRAVKTLLAALLSGSMLLQAGSCTTQAVKVQVARGVASTLTGLFNITSTDVANELLDVDD